jgi:hypothetical protein
MKDALRKLRQALLEDLGLRSKYRQAHSPTGVMRRRIRQNPDTGEYEVLPDPEHEEKPKRSPDDPRNGNLRGRK